MSQCVGGDSRRNPQLAHLYHRERVVVIELTNGLSSCSRSMRVSHFESGTPTPDLTLSHCRRMHLFILIPQLKASIKCWFEAMDASEELGKALIKASGDNLTIEIYRLLTHDVKGARHNAKCHFGHTPLHEAADNRQKEAAIVLLDHGADVNVKDKQGFSPLMYLAEEGSHLLVEFLIQVNRIE